jgi:hypothetical protein
MLDFFSRSIERSHKPQNLLLFYSATHMTTRVSSIKPIISTEWLICSKFSNYSPPSTHEIKQTKIQYLKFILPPAYTTCNGCRSINRFHQLHGIISTT